MLRSLALPVALLSLAACASTTKDAPVEADPTPAAAPSDDPIVVLDDLETAVQRAQAAGLPVLVTFTSHTCINCRMMEVTVFEQPKIRALRAGYIEARLHTDAADEALRTLIADQTRTIARTSAQPVYVVLDPSSGSEIGRFAGAALGDTETFETFLASPGGDS